MTEVMIQLLNQRYGCDLQFYDAPDLPGGAAARSRSLPDFLLDDRRHPGERWSIEIKRLVLSQVREAYSVAQERLNVLTGQVPGTYKLELRIDAADPRSRLDIGSLMAAVNRIRRDAAGGGLPSQYEPEPGYTLVRIEPSGSRVHAWIWDYELDYADTRTPAIMGLLGAEFARILTGSQAKFNSVGSAHNLLLIETRGTHIDRELVWSGELSRWLHATPVAWTSRDIIWVDIQVSVWQDGMDRRILMGHKYAADIPYTPLGSVWRLWPEPANHAVGP